MKIERVWAMPNGDTFDIKPIKELVQRYLQVSKVSIDPFARNKRWATYTNDLNPQTLAESHTDAETFLKDLVSRGIIADLVLFDPPYSISQMKEIYSSIGLKFAQREAQNAVRFSIEKSLLPNLVHVGGHVITCGWNTNGVGKKNGFEIEEILVVAHGSGHNDTLVTVERKTCRTM